MSHFIHRAATVAMAVALLMASAAVVSADNLQNELDVGTPDTTLDDLNVALTGGPVMVDVWLDASNEPSDNNCNLDSTGTYSDDYVDFDVASSNTGIATVSPTTFQLTACGSANSQAITITPVAQGTATVQFTLDTGNSHVDSGEVFVANTGDFTVVVDDPPSVTSTVPTDGATGVAANTDITVNFSEAVTITNTNGWYDIDC